MKNNTNYFSHDCNARDDEKIMLLRSEYWWEWYGIFWLMIEKLSEATEYKLLLTNKLVISKLYQANIEVINYLFELWLLEEQGEYMYSPSLLYRMQLKLDKKLKQSEWWKKAMLSRWKNKSDSETDKLLITSKVKESKVKEIKENNIKEDIYKEETTSKDVFVKKRSIINQHNKKWAIEIYDKIKEMCVVVDGSLDDCVVLRSKLEKYWSDPVNLLEIMITKMRDTWLNKFYSVSNPWKLADHISTIVEKLKSEKPKKTLKVF